ncbi:MAG: hypothetical protein E2P02_23855 [Acidobacteria bacterium]|nr:MAG: hypothetical protein E2P02_23855 [Acidobacteriota bacterium]
MTLFAYYWEYRVHDDKAELFRRFTAPAVIGFSSEHRAGMVRGIGVQSLFLDAGPTRIAMRRAAVSMASRDPTRRRRPCLGALRSR